jgi:transposase
MESTSIYHLPILKQLLSHTLFVSVINPLVMNKYAKTKFRPSKTDNMNPELNKKSPSAVYQTTTRRYKFLLNYRIRIQYITILRTPVIIAIDSYYIIAKTMS